MTINKKTTNMHIAQESAPEKKIHQKIDFAFLYVSLYIPGIFTKMPMK